MSTNQDIATSINIIDVRTPGEFYSGHAEGSINIPLNELMDRMDYLKGLKGQIILCCASGMRSGTALYTLKQNGFTNVTNAGAWYDVLNILANQ